MHARLALALTLAIPPLSAGAQATNSLGEQIKAARVSCDASSRSVIALIACYNDTERTVWQANAPEAVPYFEKLAAERRDIAQRLTAGAITPDVADAELKDVQGEFVSALQSLDAAAQARAAEAEARQQAEQQQQATAEQAQRDYENCKSSAMLLGAIAAFSRAGGSGGLNAATAGLQACREQYGQ